MFLCSVLKKQPWDLPCHGASGTLVVGRDKAATNAPRGQMWELTAQINQSD